MRMRSAANESHSLLLRLQGHLAAVLLEAGATPVDRVVATVLAGARECEPIDDQVSATSVHKIHILWQRGRLWTV